MSKKQYSISDARADFPAIVREAEAGQEIEVTRRGKPVAVVISRRELDQLRGERPGFKKLYEDFLAKHPNREFYFDEDFVDQVRDRSPGRDVTL